MIISRSNVLRMRNVADKCRRENKNTNFMFKKVFLRGRGNCGVCEVKSKTTVEADRLQMAI